MAAIPRAVYGARRQPSPKVADMSTAPPAPDSGADAGEESTALFAELDALLERMLALPVSSRDEPEAPAEGPPPPQDLPPLITIAEATPEPVLTYTTPPA